LLPRAGRFLLRADGGIPGRDSDDPLRAIRTPAGYGGALLRPVGSRPRRASTVFLPQPKTRGAEDAPHGAYRPHATGADRSVDDLALWESVLQLLDAVVGYLGKGQAQRLQLFMGRQLLQAGVRDVGETEAQRLQFLQFREVFQPGVGDLRA